MSIRALVLVLVLLELPAVCFARGAQDVIANEPKAVAYRAELLRLIRESRRIVIVEHSNPLDVVPVDGRAPAPRPERVYGTRALDKAQRRYFLQRITQVRPDLVTWSSMCAFVDHHAIYFFGKGAKPTRLDVCFECGEVEWVGGPKAAPEGLVAALSDVVSFVGLSPQRDWKALMAAPAK